ncbi:ETX/MTX2 family pore-forming toxin [Hazenella sp. IB182357]|uniref:ETX/MTX2 family pore-forming toxin n=1 Tax=Polycladospora coralii TaxID=2771432 RepID=A0A926NBQ3_9BACL|nr:ETX/MTX2 family pore-forming toxin [Polycladospora coralii]MBD1373986.1 ETX/MTX2 family pore-forming toxin [Polycladospora coralii]
MGKISKLLCASVLSASMIFGAVPSTQASTSFYDLDSEIKKAVAAYNDAEVVWIHNKNLSGINSSVEQIGQITYSTSDKSTYVGTSELVNNTDEEQTLTTQSFSETLSDTLETTVEEGLSIGQEITASGELAGIGVETSFSAEYSLSSSETTSTTTEQSYTAEAQEIVVPANTIRNVNVFLRRTLASGKVALDTHLTGSVKYEYVQDFDDDGFASVEEEVSIYDIFKNGVSAGYKMPSNISLDHSTKTVKFSGVGVYTAEYGADFYVEVDDETIIISEPTPLSPKKISMNH